MERGLMMLVHSAIISAILYIVMVYAMGSPSRVAETRSLAIGAIVLLYMLMFGHDLPQIWKKCTACSGAAK
jgi:hypothetical protein